MPADCRTSLTPFWTLPRHVNRKFAKPTRVDGLRAGMIQYAPQKGNLTIARDAPDENN